MNIAVLGAPKCGIEAANVEDCLAAVEGSAGTGAEHLARFPRLACVVRMGVGYDKIDRQAAAQRKAMVCNVPDYGTTEVADHALALAL